VKLAVDVAVTAVKAAVLLLFWMNTFGVSEKLTVLVPDMNGTTVDVLRLVRVPLLMKFGY